MVKRLNIGLRWLSAFGIEPFKTLLAIKTFSQTVKEYKLLKKQNLIVEQKWHLEFTYPNLFDKNSEGGVASGHYFHQDLAVARRIYNQNPIKHVDVGSRIDGFVAHVAVFREIEVFDIRSLENKIPNIKFSQKDIMNPNGEISNYCDSLSCLHTLEHFGLGRYGDSIDINGYKKGFNILTKMLKPNGTLYLSVPIGKERIEFNGHRIFSLKRVFDLFKDRFDLVAFSYVDDDGAFHENVMIGENSFENNFNLGYGCGIFELKKREV